MANNNINILQAMFPNSKQHKECYNRLLNNIEEDGFTSLLVHPDFQKEHNREGRYVVYIESENRFYTALDVDGYMRRCMDDNNIKPNEICAINKQTGKFYGF
jgi:hypothetical protein